MAELAPKYLDTTLFRIVNGSIPETTRVGFRVHLFNVKRVF
jgi:hypothetical protein